MEAASVKVLEAWIIYHTLLGQLVGQTVGSIWQCSNKWVPDLREHQAAVGTSRRVWTAAGAKTRRGP